MYLRFLLIAAFTLIASISNGSAQKISNVPLLPFEKFFSEKFSGHQALKFNDFSGKINSSRIKKLLRTGNILGDRVLLHNDNAVYFPEGYIISSSFKLEQWRPKNGIHPRQIYSIEDVEPHPHFDFVQKMDRYLGRVCATIPSQNPAKIINVRKSSDGVYSLVKRTKGRLDRIVGQPTEDIEVTSALSPAHLSKDYKVQQIALNCI